MDFKRAAFVPKDSLRKQFAESLAKMFAGEVPEYSRFTELVRFSNENYLATHPNAIVDSEHRVLAEKHGAIRVGTKEEMRMVTRIFAALGMQPVEFYDLTQLPKGPLPMIATAFRPIDKTIENSAFRMFCSMLLPDYIPEQLKGKVEAGLAGRREENPKFSERLRQLLTISETKGGLTGDEAQEFISEVVNSFRINKERAINFDLYRELREVNDVYADIVCLGINLNHLTPRAYDIQEAAQRLINHGIPMKDGGIEGPPIRDDGVIIQLNQTSRKAPGEALTVSNHASVLNAKGDELADYKATAPKIGMEEGEDVKAYLARIAEALKTNKLVVIEHKARFGEIESRGVALTVEGEALYKSLLAKKKFKTDFPKTHEELFEQGLAYYNFAPTAKGLSSRGKIPDTDLHSLVKQGYVRLIPQTYNDFLAASAAGIFRSNLSPGAIEASPIVKPESANNIRFLQTAIGRNVVNRHTFHKAEQADSITNVYRELNLQIPQPLKAECEKAKTVCSLTL